MPLPFVSRREYEAEKAKQAETIRAFEKAQREYETFIDALQKELRESIIDQEILKQRNETLMMRAALYSKLLDRYRKEE